MLRTRLRAVAAASALALALATGVTGATFASATEAGDGRLPLANAAESYSNFGECPAGAEVPYWHFVAPPPSKSTIVSIELNLDGNIVVIGDDDWIRHDKMGGHAYVPVPSGYTLDSLDGGWFEVTGESDKVVLSHVCDPGVSKVEKLDVSKTAVTTYQRAHHWSLDKSVDQNLVKLSIDGSGDTTLNYTVAVGYENFTDSGWNVSGVVTIKNSGNVDAEIAAITDTMTLGGVTSDVVLDCGDGADGLGVLAEGASLSCTYSVDTDAATTGTNDVVVSTMMRDYEASAAVVWGAPASESDKTVTVTDVGDLTGTKLESFTAPTGGSLTYSVPLAYADYGQTQCGDHVYDNEATLTGDDDEVLATDDESVTVKVQCLVFKGETAWAGGDRYNKRGNWATYVTGEGKTVDLFAGQTMKAGSVTLSEPEGGKVTITVTLADGWSFVDKAENLKVQGYSKAPSGNPDPGNFADKADCDASSNTCSITVDDANYYGIHVDVGRWMPDPKF